MLVVRDELRPVSQSVISESNKNRIRDEELTGIEDTTADNSLSTDQSATSSSFQTLSNPGQLPIINETNELLRDRRELYRQRKRETRQKAGVSSATVTSPVKTEVSSERNNSGDKSPCEEMITQPENSFRQVQLSPDQLQSPTSGQNSDASSEAKVRADDRQTQSIYGDDDNQLSDITEVTSRRKRKQTQHFRMPINSGTRGLFTAEHYNAILETIVVSNEDKITNFEMLMRSREKELEGWTEFGVVREVHVDEINRKKNVSLLTRWVDNFFRTAQGK